MMVGGNTMELVRYEAARSALRAANSFDEVKDIRDKAVALEAYAKQAKDTELVEQATEIRLRAERRAGEMLEQGKKNGALDTGRGGDRKSRSHTPTVKLADIGVTKTQSSRWQKLAALPEARFEKTLQETKHSVGKVTTVGMLRPHVTNNSGENEWYTPSQYVEAARIAMGGIDCDPASSRQANKAIRAALIFTLEDDGLLQPWEGRVWMNPPYAQPLCQQFCAALVEKYNAKEIEQACVLVNNATETVWFQDMLASCACVCFIKGRIKFNDANGDASKSPLQGQAVLYFGKRLATFQKQFQQFGLVFVPA
jgi:16S rRNA G966 N2-methylase RsmD